MAKRYYWLKIKRDFFGQREIKKLRRLENGDTCVIIYMKMLTLALDQNNHIVFKRLEDTFEEDIALELDEDVSGRLSDLGIMHLNATYLNAPQYIYLSDIENPAIEDSDAGVSPKAKYLNLKSFVGVFSGGALLVLTIVMIKRKREEKK